MKFTGEDTTFLGPSSAVQLTAKVTFLWRPTYGSVPLPLKLSWIRHCPGRTFRVPGLVVTDVDICISASVVATTSVVAILFCVAAVQHFLRL